MRKYRSKVLFLLAPLNILLMGFPLSAFPALKDSQTSFQLQNPFKVRDKEEKGRASLGDLLKKEENKDLTPIRIVGHIKINRKNETTITWDHLELKTKETVKTRKLSKQLQSIFKTTKKELTLGTKIKAKGDLKTLIREARLLLTEEKEGKIPGREDRRKEGVGRGGILQQGHSQSGHSQMGHPQGAHPQAGSQGDPRGATTHGNTNSPEASQGVHPHIGTSEHNRNSQGLGTQGAKGSSGRDGSSSTRIQENSSSDRTSTRGLKGTDAKSISGDGLNGSSHGSSEGRNSNGLQTNRNEKSSGLNGINGFSGQNGGNSQEILKNGQNGSKGLSSENNRSSISSGSSNRSLGGLKGSDGSSGKNGMGFQGTSKDGQDGSNFSPRLQIESDKNSIVLNRTGLKKPSKEGLKESSQKKSSEEKDKNTFGKGESKSIDLSGHKNKKGTSFSIGFGSEKGLEGRSLQDRGLNKRKIEDRNLSKSFKSPIDFSSESSFKRFDKSSSEKKGPFKKGSSEIIDLTDRRRKNGTTFVVGLNDRDRHSKKDFQNQELKNKDLKNLFEKNNKTSEVLKKSPFGKEKIAIIELNENQKKNPFGDSKSSNSLKEVSLRGNKGGSHKDETKKISFLKTEKRKNEEKNEDSSNLKDLSSEEKENIFNKGTSDKGIFDKKTLNKGTLDKNHLKGDLEKLSLDLEDRESSLKTDDTEEDKIEIILTKEGCDPRVDVAQGVVIIQTRGIRKKNGIIVDKGTCGDTFTRFPILRSYACEDVVEEKAKKASPQFKTYWKDENQEEHLIKGCQVDKELVFSLVEDPTLCAPLVQIEEGKVIPRSEPVYANKNNQRVQVKSCRPTPNATPLSLKWTAEGCGLQHDFKKHKSVVMKRAFYEGKDGYVFVSPCTETKETISHEKISCSPIVEGDLAIPQFKWGLKSNLGIMSLTDCAPDKDQAQFLKKTTEGCEDRFIHDRDSGKSYETVRYYHSLGEIDPTFVTDCVKGTKEYPHKVDIESYVHDAKKKESLPKASLYIETSEGKKTIEGPQTRKDLTALSWVLTDTQTVLRLGKQSFEGCHRLTPSQKVEIYERPDGSTVTQVVGEGPTHKSGDECIREIERKKEYEKTRLHLAPGTLMISGGGGGFSKEGRYVSGSPISSKRNGPAEATIHEFVIKENPSLKDIFQKIYTLTNNKDEYSLMHGTKYQILFSGNRGPDSFTCPMFEMSHMKYLEDVFAVLERTKTSFPENHQDPSFSDWEKVKEESKKLNISKEAFREYLLKVYKEGF